MICLEKRGKPSQWNKAKFFAAVFPIWKARNLKLFQVKKMKGRASCPNVVAAVMIFFYLS